MGEDRMALLETLRKATAEDDVDLLPEGVRVLRLPGPTPTTPKSPAFCFHDAVVVGTLRRRWKRRSDCARGPLPEPLAH